MAYVKDLLTDIGQRIQNCPGIAMQNAYVRAARDFCAKSTWLRYVQAGSLVPNVEVYALGTDPNLEIIGIPNWQITIPTNNVTSGWLVAGTAFNPNNGPGSPLNLAYVPEGQFAVNPIPVQAFNVLVSLILQPAVGTLQLPDVLIRKWDRTIQAGALAYLYSLKSEAWYDPNESGANEMTFRSGWTDAKIDVQRGYQYGPARTRARPFLT